MASFTTPDNRAAAIAANQAAAIAHRQARQAGLSNDQIDHRVATGVWSRPVRGVYVVAGSPDTPQQRLWIAHLATSEAGGVVSYLSAAAVFGLAAFPPLPHVTVPPLASAGCRGARVHRGTVLSQDRTRRSGLLVTSVSRTLADCATILDRPSFEQLVDVAFCRKLATEASTLAAGRRAGARRRGMALLRDVTRVWGPRIEPGSPAEMRLLRIAAELGLDDLVPQFEVYDQNGLFVARLDVASPSRFCAFEYDGLEHHGPRAWSRDEPRYARLKKLGWRVESVTKADLLPGDQRLRQIIRRWT